MKFFSNDAKENPDDDDRQHGDVVTSEPAAVPQQRAGSPWTDTPGQSEDEPADAERREQTDAWGHAQPASTTYGPDGTVVDSPDRDTRDEPENPSDSTVSDESLKDEGTFTGPEAVDPATGEALDRTHEAAVPLTEDRVDTTDDAEVGPQADADHGTASTLDDATVDTAAEREAQAEEEARADRDDEASTDDHSDTADHHEGFGGKDTADDHEGFARTDTADDHEGFARTDTADDHEGFARTDTADDHEGFGGKDAADEPAPIDPTTGESLDRTADDSFEPVPVAVAGERAGDPVLDGATGDAAPAVAVVPVDTPAAATPGSTVEPLPDRLFPTGDTFAERFREIQLGFVDTPKESAAQAASLVTEAVDQFTSALNERKNALAANSDDTEQLRVELRGYRDLLNRITGL